MRSADRRVSRTVGELCGAATTPDLVGAHVALLVRNDDVVLTNDVDDLRILLRTRGVTPKVRLC